MLFFRYDRFVQEYCRPDFPFGTWYSNSGKSKWNDTIIICLHIFYFSIKLLFVNISTMLSTSTELDQWFVSYSYDITQSRWVVWCNFNWLDCSRDWLELLTRSHSRSVNLWDDLMVDVPVHKARMMRGWGTVPVQVIRDKGGGRRSFQA